MAPYRIQLEFVPPSGDDVEFTHPWDGPEIPRTGDVILVDYADGHGGEGLGTFIVIRTVWQPALRLAQVVCEFASGHVDGASHKELIEQFESQGEKIRKAAVFDPARTN